MSDDIEGKLHDMDPTGWFGFLIYWGWGKCDIQKFEILCFFKIFVLYRIIFLC